MGTAMHRRVQATACEILRSTRWSTQSSDTDADVIKAAVGDHEQGTGGAWAVGHAEEGAGDQDGGAAGSGDFGGSGSESGIGGAAGMGGFGGATSEGDKAGGGGWGGT